jgi:hypothetical protein
MGSLPSKGVRNKLADALNLWADLPEDAVEHVKEVVGDLHTASLMYVPLNQHPNKLTWTKNHGQAG